MAHDKGGSASLGMQGCRELYRNVKIQESEAQLWSVNVIDIRKSVDATM